MLDGFVVRVRQTGEEPEQPAETVYDGQGRYLIPGYIDTHMHIESTMMIPENLARAILPWGTTTICTDPHEIGNVMGLDGVRFMLANAKKSKLRGSTCLPRRAFQPCPAWKTPALSSSPRKSASCWTWTTSSVSPRSWTTSASIQDSERMHTIIDEGLQAAACSCRAMRRIVFGT